MKCRTKLPIWFQFQSLLISREFPCIRGRLKTDGPTAAVWGKVSRVKDFGSVFRFPDFPQKSSLTACAVSILRSRMTTTNGKPFWICLVAAVQCTRCYYPLGNGHSRRNRFLGTRPSLLKGGCRDTSNYHFHRAEQLTPPLSTDELTMPFRKLVGVDASVSSMCCNSLPWVIWPLGDMDKMYPESNLLEVYLLRHRLRVSSLTEPPNGSTWKDYLSFTCRAFSSDVARQRACTLVPFGEIQQVDPELFCS